jgi:hypothetical protein
LIARESKIVASSQQWEAGNISLLKMVMPWQYKKHWYLQPLCQQAFSKKHFGQQSLAVWKKPD